MEEEKKPKVLGGIKDKLVFFGPGLLLAITAAGEAGITEALEIGAHFHLTLLWVVILTLLFKYAFTTGIARYTLATGKTIFEGFGSLPGPKNWGFILTIVSYMVEVVSVGAMILFVATFLDYLIPVTYYIPLLGIFILLLVLLVLRTHVYHHFELIMAGMVVLLSFIAVFALSFYVDSPLSV
ncbi:MAG TPA: Nramp family divalent metal transporter, partial [Methanocorpusculum sp.]|nr:Nramp family divalent metal transporter [Methanocorpusculum sp.]